MTNYQEQELSLQLCIIAIMQKEELPDSRNRQAAENDRRQNEDQIWQRLPSPAMHTRIIALLLIFLPFLSSHRPAVVSQPSKVHRACTSRGTPARSSALEFFEGGCAW
jgi:hypothetical protein